MPVAAALLLVLTTCGLAVLATLVIVRRRLDADTQHTSQQMIEAVTVAVDAARQQAVAERDAAIRVALEHSASLNREQLGAQHAAGSAELAAKKDVIDSRLDQMHTEMRGELTRLGHLVNQLGQASAERFGQVDQSLRAHAEVAGALADSTRTLREALANPKARGQWGERMAEDVLRLAGFSENVNYVKQTQVEGASGLPDYTFQLPKGHVLYMDVKFPLASYLKHLEAGSDAERQAHLAQFLRDVRLRVKELAGRGYAASGTRPSVDYVLLFLPNEQLTSFIHENDPELIEHALSQKVVMCSPLTLFAFLGVIRQAFDNFMVEQTSDEILGLLGTFSQQWGKFNDSLDTVKRRLDSTQREFDQLVGTRRRQLETPLRQLDALRTERGLALDGQLFGGELTAAIDFDEPSDDRAAPVLPFEGVRSRPA